LALGEVYAVFVLVLFTLGLCGCATGYQSSSFSGGYTDSLTGNNTAIVSFKSNAFTSMEETRRYAMRRAAEVTLQNGFDYFLIEGDNQYLKNQQLSGSVNCTTIGYSTTCTPIGGGSVSKPRVQLDIRMFKGDLPNQTGYYDARFLAN